MSEALGAGGVGMDPRVGVEWALGAGSKRWGKDLHTQLDEGPETP